MPESNLLSYRRSGSILFRMALTFLLRLMNVLAVLDQGIDVHFFLLSTYYNKCHYRDYSKTLPTALAPPDN